MRTGDVADAIMALGRFQFRGDPDAEIQGVTVAAVAGGLASQYSVLTDDAWPGELARRRQVDWKTLPERVEKAVRNGIEGFICNEKFAEHPALAGQNVFIGADSQDVFFRLGEILRDDRGDSKIIAVTGSAGKTTTKRMLAHALEAAVQDSSILATPRSFNGASEVLRYLSRSAARSHSVLEVGISAFPRFRKHEFATSADVSIVTSISEAHMISHESLENIALTKSQIFDRPPPGGTAIVNIDSPYSELLLKRAVEQGCQVMTYGESPHAGLRLLAYDPMTGEVTARVAGDTVNYVLGARGKHMALNSLAVVATLRSLRLPQWWTGVQALAEFEVLSGRGAVHDVRLPGGRTVTVVDESYNANHGSMRAAMELASQTPKKRTGRLIMVLGDMFALGHSSPRLHAELAPNVAATGAAVVHLIGEHMRHLHDKLLEVGFLSSKHWEKREDLTTALLTDLREGDEVLVKSSNGMELSEIVGRLKESQP